jgi:hypothetical protein
MLQFKAVAAMMILQHQQFRAVAAMMILQHNNSELLQQ